MKCDVLVVGAGPGGLIAARTSAELGLETILVERQYEIGYPVRTSGGTYVSDMEDLGIPSRFYNPLSKVTIASTQEKAEFSYEKNTGCILDLRATYQYLAMEAAKKGCRIELGSNVRGLNRKEGVSVVNVAKSGRNEEIESKVIIDASGISAVIAREVGIGQTWQRYGIGIEYEAYVDHLDKDNAYLLVGKTYAPTGYCWVFPLADNRARVGVGVTRPDSRESPRELLDRVISSRPVFLESLGKITPIEIHEGSVPIEEAPSTTTADRLMVLGDAACQANPMVGEGIRIAMKFGRLAAQVAWNAIQNGDTTVKSLKEYEKESRKVAKQNSVGLKIQRRMAGYTDSDWNDAIRNLGSFSAEEFIRLLRADFSPKTLLDSALKHPELALGLMLKLIRDIT